MRAVVVNQAITGIEVMDHEKPALVAHGQALVKVEYCGVCHTDLHVAHGDFGQVPGRILGHEGIGIVEEVGEGVKTLKKGDRVAGVPLVPCMECEDCQKGNYSLCKHYSFIGSREFGSFAEYVTVPEKNAVKFEDEVSFEQGAFFEPATVALHGLNRVDYHAGECVAILGGGTIGLFTAQWAKIFGAKKVVVFDISPERLELAKKLGVDEGINTLDEDFMNQAMAVTDGKGFGYIYETAGVTTTMKYAFEEFAGVINKRESFISVPNP